MGVSSKGQNIWLQWMTLAVIILIYASLWLVQDIEWHIGVSLITLILLAFMAKSPLRTFGFILILIAFLVILQLTFSNYMRELFIRSIETGFRWSDWIYLLYAVERLALPLMIISIFTPRLSDPKAIAGLTSLLNPLKFLGLNITRLQTILLLALRFLPTMKKEWDRLTYFQTYFSRSSTGKGPIERAKYLRGILKAMIAHTVDRAVTTGDLIAIRGLPSIHFTLRGRDLILSAVPWLGVGIITLMISQVLCILWSLMTLWMMLAAYTVERVEAE